jgi:hypothetical protein
VAVTVAVTVAVVLLMVMAVIRGKFSLHHGQSSSCVSRNIKGSVF